MMRIGEVEGGGDAFNIIPSRVELQGTVRTYSPLVRDTVVQRLHEIVERVAAGCGAEAELEVEALSPPVLNDPEVAQVVRAAAAVVVGEENVTAGDPTMGSEDAAYFLQEVPGCYFFLGSADSARGLDAPHHNPGFDIDEAVLSVGVHVMVRALAHYL